METKQPVWKQVAQLGDVHPLDYGGLFVYVDETGVYPPEMERVQPNSEDDDSLGWEVRRVVLENLTADTVTREWFFDSLPDVAAYSDAPGIIEGLLSANPAERARAWEAIGNYHGWDSLDSDPLTFTSRAELEARYKAKQ